MSFSQDLLDTLRDDAYNGKDICSLVQVIRDNTEPDDFNSFLVVNCFMQAFDLSFGQVKELSGANCLGGGVYTNSEIDVIIQPHISAAISKK
jgi:hypothetical protein